MPDTDVESAFAFLRGHTTADMRFDEHLRPVRYVTAPDGRLVLPAMVAMLQTGDTVLFIPDYCDDCLQVQVTLSPLDEHGDDGGLTDRWRIYHGDPEDVRWAMANVDAARRDDLVIDGDALMRPNPLADVESGICRRVNGGDRNDLRMLCRHWASIDVETPVLVGLDPLGLDIRGAFQVVRVPTSEPMTTADEVTRIMDAMVAQARTST
jgi:hypothetical protein